MTVWQDSTSLTTEVIAFTTHAPGRPVSIKHAPASWLTPVIKRTICKRDRAKTRNKKYPCQES